jgi:hypothetical protein
MSLLANVKMEVQRLVELQVNKLCLSLEEHISISVFVNLSLQVDFH